MMMTEKIDRVTKFEIEIIELISNHYTKVSKENINAVRIKLEASKLVIIEVNGTQISIDGITNIAHPDFENEVITLLQNNDILPSNVIPSVMCVEIKINPPTKLPEIKIYMGIPLEK